MEAEVEKIDQTRYLFTSTQKPPNKASMSRNLPSNSQIGPSFATFEVDMPRITLPM
jgi:hypothetical protein